LVDPERTFANHAIRLHAVARQDVELDHDISGTMDRDVSCAVAAAEHDRHSALQQHHDVVRGVALPEEDLAHHGSSDVPVRFEQVQLLIRQLREQRRVVVVQQGHAIT
jgi:hypothetical protein